MFKSNREIIAENMPDSNAILILKKDLQTEKGIITKGTRVNLCQEAERGLCDCYKITWSDDYEYINLRDFIRKNGERILSSEVPKYPQGIQKFVSEYFTLDNDRTNEYKAYLEKRHINVSLILFLMFWFTGLTGMIGKSAPILGWLKGMIGTSVPISAPVLGWIVWSVVGIMGVLLFVCLGMESATEENKETLKKLLK